MDFGRCCGREYMAITLKLIARIDCNGGGCANSDETIMNFNEDLFRSAAISYFEKAGWVFSGGCTYCPKCAKRIFNK
jgi:hypothetical protein